MLRIDKSNKEFVVLERKTMRESGYWERRDIQDMICRTPDEFCEELGEYIYFVGSEVHPTDFVQDRIDLLGVDADGAAVIIEIKRDSHKLHLLQALSYAGMVAKWEAKRFLDELCKFNKQGQTVEQAAEELAEELEEGDVEAINRIQRIVLLAEEFDYEVLITAEWLTEKYAVDIRCYRLSLAKDGDSDFLTCSRTYPPPELTEVAIRRRRKKETGGTEAGNWNDLLQSWVENPAEANFIRSELASKEENQPVRRTLTYRNAAGKRRYRLYAKKQFAYVIQWGRFDRDEEYWSKRLGPNTGVKTRHHGRALRFRLRTEADFAAFKSAWKTELSTLAFSESDSEPEVEEGSDTDE